MKTPYTEHQITTMKVFLTTLSEKEKRRFAGIEAINIGRGGIRYIAKIFRMHTDTVMKGKREIQQIECTGADALQKRIRKPGGGRKKKIDANPSLNKKFNTVIKDNTAGDPMNEKVKWTNMTQEEISEHLKKKGPKSVPT